MFSGDRPRGYLTPSRGFFQDGTPLWTGAKQDWEAVGCTPQAPSEPQSTAGQLRAILWNRNPPAERLGALMLP